MDALSPYPVALWEGDSKWEVTPSGNISVCSLKRIILAYIAENLGDVCDIEPLNSDIVVERDSTCVSSFEKPKPRTIEIVSEIAMPNSWKDTTGISDGNNVFECNKSMVTGLFAGLTWKTLDSHEIARLSRIKTIRKQVISSNVFNFPNYGKMYHKSDSTEVPGNDKRIKYLFNGSHYRFTFRDSRSYLSPKISHMLLEELDRCGIVNDSILSLFDNDNSSFHRVSIRRCGNLLSMRGLHFLQLKKISRLELHGLTIPACDLHHLLNDWTINNLTAFSLSGYSPSNWRTMSSSPSDIMEGVVNLVTKLKNLQELDLSVCKCLCSESLREMLLYLPRLWRLDISYCDLITTIEPLTIVSHHLEHLSLAGVMIESTAITIDVLRGLSKLRYLDVSTSASLEFSHEECINDVLVDENFAPNIEFVDVSNQTEVSPSVLLRFLFTHPKVRCIGLINVPQCADFNTAEWPSVVFLRDVFSEDRLGAVVAVSDCIQHYKHRPVILHRIMKQAVTAIAGLREPQPQLIATVLHIAEIHPALPYVQDVVCELLYNLTTGPLGSALNQELLRSVIYAVIHAMTMFRNHHQIQKYALLMLCCDNVLHQVPFNQYWVAMMALFSLRRQNEDSVNLMAVGILSILAAKLNSKQTAKLCSNPRFMTELLNLVRKRIEDVSADITLQFTLSALWNLTDESPLTCELFLKQEGLQLFINLLQTFPENTSVETKVLGLFNNVAEVPKLRYRLLQPQFIAMLRRQIKSEHIAVSYFAAGISAHLVCTGKEAWCQVEDLPFDDLLNELGEAVLSWESHIEEMVAYKSFQPFLPLLHASVLPYVQLWALWALHHVTENCKSYYCPMLIREGIPDLLQRMQLETRTSAPFVSDLATKLLCLVEEHNHSNKMDNRNKPAASSAALV